MEENLKALASTLFRAKMYSCIYTKTKRIRLEILSIPSLNISKLQIMEFQANLKHDLHKASDPVALRL